MFGFWEDDPPPMGSFSSYVYDAIKSNEIGAWLLENFYDDQETRTIVGASLYVGVIFLIMYVFVYQAIKHMESDPKFKQKIAENKRYSDIYQKQKRGQMWKTVDKNVGKDVDSSLSFHNKWTDKSGRVYEDVILGQNDQDVDMAEIDKMVKDSGLNLKRAGKKKSPKKSPSKRERSPKKAK